MTKVEDLISHYSLKPHPEGGYAKLLYESNEVLTKKCLPEEFKSSRSLWNAIYYLLPSGSKSILHRIRMEEMWNFYIGGPLELYDISPEGELNVITLGTDFTKGQVLSYVFPKGHWIGARPHSSSIFSFVSCVTCPGFTFEDWEKASKAELSAQFPTLKKLIFELAE